MRNKRLDKFEEDCILGLNPGTMGGRKHILYFMGFVYLQINFSLSYSNLAYIKSILTVLFYMLISSYTTHIRKEYVRLLRTHVWDVENPEMREEDEKIWVAKFAKR